MFWSARTSPRCGTTRHVASVESGDVSPHSKVSPRHFFATSQLCVFALNLSWKQHPDLVERAEAGGQFHARRGVETEFRLAGIRNLADGNSRRENPAFTAGDHLLAGFQNCVAEQVVRLTSEFSIGPPGLMTPRSCAGLRTRAETRQAGSSIKTTCERV